MSYYEPGWWNITFATIFIGLAAGLIWGIKDDAPNKKTYRNVGIFFFVFGFVIYGYEIARLYFAYKEMTGGYEMPQSAVVEPAAPVANAAPVLNAPVVNAVEPAPVVNNAPNGTVIVNNPVPNNAATRNVGVGRRNNNVRAN